MCEILHALSLLETSLQSLKVEIGSEPRLSLNVFSNSHYTHRASCGSALSIQSLQSRMIGTMHALRGLRVLDLDLHDYGWEYLERPHLSRNAFGTPLLKMALTELAPSLHGLTIKLRTTWNDINKEWDQKSCCYHRRFNSTILRGTQYHEFETVVPSVTFRA